MYADNSARTFDVQHVQRCNQRHVQTEQNALDPLQRRLVFRTGARQVKLARPQSRGCIWGHECEFWVCAHVAAPAAMGARFHHHITMSIQGITGLGCPSLYSYMHAYNHVSL